MMESPERKSLRTDKQMLPRNHHRNGEVNLTLVSDGCENSDSVVDKKPGCKATGCLFVKNERKEKRTKKNSTAP